MVVELLDNKKLWDQFVEDSPQGLLFHKWDFLKTVERHSGYQFLPYSVYLADELRCIFPFFIARGRLGLTHMLSPPPGAQITYLGPAFDPSVQALSALARQKIFEQVTGDLCKEIDKIGPNFVNFRTAPNFLDVRSFMWEGFTAHLMFTYTIDLERSLDEIWGGFVRRCKRGIRHVSTLSPEVLHTNDVSLVLGMWRDRFNELGLKAPVFSDSYIQELAATFPKRVTVHSVCIDGSIAGAIVCCALCKDRYGYWIGNVNARRDLNTNEFLTWGIIQLAKSEGFKKLDLIGTQNQRISEFKSNFNPVLEPFCYVKRTDRLGGVVNFAYSKLGGGQILPRWSERELNGARGEPDLKD